MKHAMKFAAGLLPVIAWILVGPARAEEAFPSVAPAVVVGWQESGEEFLFVDVRPPALYEMKHARGAVSIPAFAIDAKPIPNSLKVVVYDGGAGSTEAEAAARALASKTHPSFFILEGGLTAWEAQGSPIVAPPGLSPVPFVEPISVEALQRLFDKRSQVAIVEVGTATARQGVRIPGAVVAASQSQLERVVAPLKRTDLIVVYDDGNGDARDRAEELRRKGYKAVKYLYGGTRVWQQKNQAVKKDQAADK